MKALIQRVDYASVTVDEQCVGRIGEGLLVLLGIEKNDTESQIERMANRLLGYRVFEDDAGKMNLSVVDKGGELLIVSQFTLAADTNKGMRPSFSGAASPEHAKDYYERLVRRCGQLYDESKLATGRFAANMKVELLNNGPVSFNLEV